MIEAVIGESIGEKVFSLRQKACPSVAKQA
jgi:hypothetical protein